MKTTHRRRFLSALLPCVASLGGAANCGRSDDSSATAGAGAGASSAAGTGGATTASSGVASSNGAGASSSTSSGSSTGAGGGTGLVGTPIGQFTGVNGLIIDPVDLLAPLGTVREYHNWGWVCDNYA